MRSVLFSIGMVAVLLLGPGRSGGEIFPLVEEDCRKCHERELTDLQEAGGGHAVSAGCLDCHPGGHPPRVMEIIRPCRECHEGTPHVERQGPCLACHRNPHRPLALTLAREELAACLDCHPGVGSDFATAPGSHARFACTSCHETHGAAFPCLECHRPHIGSGEGQNCRSCHPPHRPQVVESGKEADPAVCAACHAKIEQRLQTGGTRHLKVGCVGCHAGPHGRIPVCRECHPAPHAEKILEKFPDCAQCHGDAHALATAPGA